jgi:iron-sulfur cluster assembly accessory protein
MIQLTDVSIRKAKEFMANADKQGWGLRVLVKGGGCSGLEYGLSLAEWHDPDDQVYEFDDLRVFVDPASSRHLCGVTIDYVDSLSESGFKIDNPNATGSCGCGSSFSV